MHYADRGRAQRQSLVSTWRDRRSFRSHALEDTFNRTGVQAAATSRSDPDSTNRRLADGSSLVAATISFTMYPHVMKDDAPSAGALLSRTRRRRRLTQAELAIRAGTSQAAISRIERGLESPTVDRLNALLQVMGETLTLSAEPMQPWADSADLASEHAMTADERLEQGIQLAQFATELAAADGQDTASG